MCVLRGGGKCMTRGKRVTQLFPRYEPNCVARITQNNHVVSLVYLKFVLKLYRLYIISRHRGMPKKKKRKKKRYGYVSY